MPVDSYDKIRALLGSARREDLEEGLALVEKEIARTGSAEARSLFEILSALFYIDLLDHPELAPIVDKAISLTVGFGTWVIPVLIEKLDAGDMKSQWMVAHVLGRIGEDAIGSLMTVYAATTNATLRAFILYALGKIRSPKILKASALALEAARASNLELRDTATRALGRLVEVVPPDQLTGEVRNRFVECLRGNLADSNVGIRAKAMRSLGKMARYGHLTGAERERLKETCQHILGTDAAGDWDRAYVVRKEAQEALGFLEA